MRAGPGQQKGERQEHWRVRSDATGAYPCAAPRGLDREEASHFSVVDRSKAIVLLAKRRIPFRSEPRTGKTKKVPGKEDPSRSEAMRTHGRVSR